MNDTFGKFILLQKYLQRFYNDVFKKSLRSGILFGILPEVFPLILSENFQDIHLEIFRKGIFQRLVQELFRGVAANLPKILQKFSQGFFQKFHQGFFQNFPSMEAFGKFLLGFL